MTIIYPVNINKYTGSISAVGKKYQARIKILQYSMSTTFSEYDDAYDWIVSKNIELNLPIKNILHDCGDYYEIELSQGKRTIV